MTTVTGRLALIAGAGLILSACVPQQTTYKTRDQLVSTASACGERRLEIYFENAQAKLVPAAVQALQMTADSLKTCQIDKVQVTGLSDARGGVTAQNQGPSERRALAVVEALEKAGLPSPTFDIQASGASGAAVDGVNDPLRRRTEVVIQSSVPR